MRILIAEDERDLNRIISSRLSDEHYSVDSCFDGEEALEYLESAAYDAVVLDIMMPKVDGLTVLRKVRGRGDATPVLLLTARDSIEDRVTGLDAGANDYLVKPFSRAELMMKVKSLLRRYVVYKGKQDIKPDGSVIQIRDILVNRENHRLMRDNQPLNITGTEYQIFMYLLENRGKAQSAQQIYEHVWGEKFMPSSAGTIMVHILNLRRKLETDPNNPVIIRTVWGRGYQIDEA